MIASLSSIKSLSTADLLKLYNALTKKSTTKFASRDNGEAQTLGAARVAGLAEVQKLCGVLGIVAPEAPKVVPATPAAPAPEAAPAAPKAPAATPAAPKPEVQPEAAPAKPGKAPRAPKPDAVKPKPEKVAPVVFRVVEGGCPLEGCGGEPGDQTPAGKENTIAGDDRNFCHKCQREYWITTGKEFARKKPGKDIGASISRSWMDKDVRAARSARHGCRVTGDSINVTDYKSIVLAFKQLRLPLSKVIKFRQEVKAKGKGDFADGKRSFHFVII